MQSFPALLIVALEILTLTVAQDGDSKTTIPPMASPSQHPYPPGDIRYCPTQSPLNINQPALYRMDVLPGGGFDNLQNVDMGQVHYHNYSLCKVSKDGKYLLPDNVFMVPVLHSHVETFAEYFDHWDDYTSMTAFSINAGGSVPSIISGKFSVEYQSVKSNQYRKASKTTRVQIRHKFYTVRLQPDSQLHPTFKARLFDMAANIQNNNTLLATYLAELLVRDYGTHYLSSVDAGGILAQVDHIHQSSNKDDSLFTFKLTALAGVDFFKTVLPTAASKHNTTENDEMNFISNRTHSQLQTYGGPRFEHGLTAAEWSRELPNGLVAIDRSGNPLHFAITPQTLPELPPVTVMEVARIVHKAINRYYEINTRKGCTIPGSKNFDFQANVIDNSCTSAETNYTFGGIYQMCEMDHTFNGTDDLCHSNDDPVIQLNPLTGDTSCPTGYMAIKLNSGKVTRVKAGYTCKKSCDSCGFRQCCKCKNIEVPFVSAANYEAFWCASLENEKLDSGYLFGGYYTSTHSNPFTSTMSCPQHFHPIHFGVDIWVCVSRDYELGFPHAIPFAGFQSCHAGNPLAAPETFKNESSKWPKACPQTYTQHLMTVENGCEISYCVLAGSFNQLPLIPPHLPPFRKYNEYQASISHIHVPAFVGVYGQVWYKGENGEWKRDSTNIIPFGNATVYQSETESVLPDNSKMNIT